MIKGTFIHLILKDPELFLSMARNNPDVTLQEIAQVENLQIN
ncbi:hypothetical protein [Francisella frigiditurris]|nr:hypothetical protein [Francisella frigiditurris]